MIDLEEAIQICEEADPNDDIIERYKYENTYYFMMRPKGLSEGEFFDTAMISVDAETGEVGFTNYVKLIYDDIVDKLQKL